MTKLEIHSLVLYKGQAGRVATLEAKRIKIELVGNDTVKVRPKDITLLHPGPVGDIISLRDIEGDVPTAWELLAGEKTTLPELAELIYGEFTPETAWSTYRRLAEGLYFDGEPAEIRVLSQEEMKERKAKISAKAEKAESWASFIERLEEGHYAPGDDSHLRETEFLALGRSDASRVLRTLGISETPENAHALLLKIGFWGEITNPYPARNGLGMESPNISLGQLPDEDRLDLTGMKALAIDDEGSEDPDDAISYEDGKIWVHIADAAGLVPADSPADKEARSRGGNLYLPDGTVRMLPSEATAMLGLGLQEVSPAISFELNAGENGEILDVRLHQSWIKATRMTYEQAEALLGEPPLAELAKISSLFEQRRLENEAVNIDLPEVKVTVIDGRVSVRAFKQLRSRTLVRETMLMVGEGVAKYGTEEGLPLPFTIQDPPQDPPERRDTISDMFALRRSLKASHQSTNQGPHAGLGLSSYVQATSPLRRYLDLVVHQQLRAHIRGEPTMDNQALIERIGAVEAVRKDLRWAERQSNEHWVLVYLLQNPGWVGEGIVVDRRGRQAIILIPELGLETRIYQRSELDLDSTIQLALEEVNLAQLRASFRLLER
jgi:exoribonuclease-2